MPEPFAYIILIFLYSVKSTLTRERERGERDGGTREPFSHAFCLLLIPFRHSSEGSNRVLIALLQETTRVNQ